MEKILQQVTSLYDLKNYEFSLVPDHEGGRNRIFICTENGEKKRVLRLSAFGDRSLEDYLAETEFVHYLAENGAPVADVIPSVNGNLVETVTEDGQQVFACLFEFAKGMLLCDNGYKYREGALLEEYFYNVGKTLGILHRLSKAYKPEHRRTSFFDKYNMDYIGGLIPDSYADLKEAIARRLQEYHELPVDEESFGLIHFDYSDGKYNIDMETGDITVYDFDNCIYCWYMFDLAHTWFHGTGWCRFEKNSEKRMEFMKHYFDTVLEGYRTECEVSAGMLEKLPLFIDMTLVEFVVDAFECCINEGEPLDYEDIEFEAKCLINDIPYAGVGDETW